MSPSASRESMRHMPLVTPSWAIAPSKGLGASAALLVPSAKALVSVLVGAAVAGVATHEDTLAGGGGSD